MTWAQVFEEAGIRVAQRHELLAAGATGRGIATAVRGGHLIRARRDHYALPGTERQLLQAVRVGGRLGCVSALHDRGIFAFEYELPHVHMRQSASRSRSPRNRAILLTPHNRDGAALHWRPLIDAADGSECAVGVRDALAQALRCQQPWHSVASLDNALFTGQIGEADLTDVFRNVPQHLQSLRSMLDGRSEAGQESVLRMIAREAGLRCELQVQIPSVGRVDMVVEGCLVVEADSRLAHDGWDKHVRDRNRDLDLGRQGYMSLRPLYARIMFTPLEVRVAILHLLAVNRNFRTMIV